MSFWKSHQFKKLNELWRSKLKKTGFKDLEAGSGELKHQQTINADLQRRMSFTQDSFESLRDYYIWAEHMVAQARFRSALDRKIWTLHSQGWTTREIAGHVPLSYRQIARKIPVIRDYIRLQIVKKKAA